MRSSTYTKADLDREARYLARQVRQETKQPARVTSWAVVICTDSACSHLRVEMMTPAGSTTRTEAI